MLGALELVTAPASEPITTAEAKTQLRVDVADDDTYIDTLIVSARMLVEAQTNRALITQTWDWILPSWWPRLPKAEPVPKAPLVSVASVKYLDTDGNQQTVTASDYVVLHAGAQKEPGRVVPAFGFSWPSHRVQENAIEVRYGAGYGAAAAVPDPIKHAIKLLVSHWYQNREPVNIGNTVNPLPDTTAALLGPYTLRAF